MNSGLHIGFFIVLLSLGIGASAQSTDGATSEQWPSFRGPDANGVSEYADLPISERLALHSILNGGNSDALSDLSSAPPGVMVH